MAHGDSLDSIVSIARHVWWHQTSVAGWLEAFAAHPRIGEAPSLLAKLGAFAIMSRHEQSGTAGASHDVFQELSEWNGRYEAKFGHVFLIYAAGKSAQTILENLKTRFESPPHEELLLAASQQMQITESRLALIFAEPALLSQESPSKGMTQPLTSHVLDTSLGRPAEGVLITLQRAAPGSPGPTTTGVWETIATQRTNKDGRVPGLLPPSDILPAGRYRVVFGTKEYMAACRGEHPGVWPADPFYPTAAVVFDCAPDQVHQHFHIPLTWSPYGYSTYRGS